MTQILTTMRCMKRKTALILLAVSVIIAAGWFIQHNSNPLRKHGVSIEYSEGGWGSFEHLQLFRTINGQRKPGPEISGSALNVTYKDYNDDELPEILVTSQGREGYFTIIRLNLTRADQPDFEIVESHMHLITYPPLGLGWP